MQAKGTATSAHAFNPFWDIAVPEIALPSWIVDLLQEAKPLPTQTPSGGADAVTVDASTTVDLRSALLSLSADDYETWMRMGMALKELGPIGRGL
jgi:hypothetical protein